MNVINTKSGIISYGAYLPRFRISVDEIAKTYNKNPEGIKGGLGLSEKTVRAIDEDTVTISANAARQALTRAEKNSSFNKNKIGAIYIGSESHPYAVKSSSAIIGEALGISNDYTAADLEFACKAGTAGMQMVFGLVESGRIDAGLAIGADNAQGAPGDALEYSAASGAASFIIGTENIIAKLIHTTSFTSDTPDFWRREHQNFPSHGGRFTGEPAYFRHVLSAAQNILKETDMKISDFDHVVFHMPNGKFPQAVAKILKVDPDQMKIGFVVPRMGNTYSACSISGFVNVLDHSKAGEKILLTSYGSGSGSDSFIFEVTKEIDGFRKSCRKIDNDKSFDSMLEHKVYLTYGQYVRHTKKLIS